MATYINRRTSYAMQTLVRLALAGDDAPLSRDVIAKSEGIPAPFLEKILQQLAGAGLIEGKKGPGGGYRLVHAPQDVSIMDVMNSIGEPVEINRCTTEEDACDRSNCCPSAAIWKKVQREIDEILRRETLASVIDGMT